MSDLLSIAESWPARVLIVGGVVLLIGRLAMHLTRQPVRRGWIGMSAVVAALLVLPLALLPSWLPVPVPASSESSAAPREFASPTPADSIAILPQRPLADMGFVVMWPRPDGMVEPPTAPLVDRTDAPDPLPASVTPAVQVSAAPRLTSSRVDYRKLSGVAYAAIVLLLLSRLVLGQIALVRLWRQAHAAPGPLEREFRLLAAVASAKAQLRISTRVTGPICFGVWRPRVLLPAALLSAGDAANLRCVLAHELNHLSRCDPLSGWLLGLARAVYFVWPWTAGVRREVRLAQENLADAAAARRAASPAHYAEMLIGMTRSRPAPLGAAGVRGTHSELYRRVTMLLRTDGRVEGRCPRRWAIAFGGGLTALAIAATGVYLQPRSLHAAEPEKKDAPKPADPARKDAPKTDAIKEAIEKLKKDAGDDPERLKQIEDLLKSLQPPAVPAPPALPQFPIPVPAPFPGGNPAELEKEYRRMQEMMQKQIEQMLGQVRARGGVLVGPGGVQPFPGMGVGGGRLGVRVERPSDVLVSQLDLPNGQGLVVADVPAESTAGKIGIKPHDVLLEVAGKAVSSQSGDFQRALKDIKPEDAVDIVVLRKGRRETLKGVKLPAAKEVADFPGLPQLPGLDVAPLFPPPLPVPPGAPGAPGVVVNVGPGETVRVEQVNDAFTVFMSKNGISLTLTGTKDADGKPKAESIEVDANGKTIKAESIEKLPKEYQELATKALKSIK